MKLSRVILGEILYYDPAFEKVTDQLRDKGAKYLGSGYYGSAYLLNGRVYKATTDEVEIEAPPEEDSANEQDEFVARLNALGDAVKDHPGIVNTIRGLLEKTEN